MIVVDTSALMSVLLSEPDADSLIQIMIKNNLCMSAGTYAEFLIVSMRRGVGDQAQDLLKTLQIQIIEVDGEQAEAVQDAYQRWGKGVHKAGLNFGDCFAYALADLKEVPLLFVGNDFTHTDLTSAL